MSNQNLVRLALILILAAVTVGGNHTMGPWIQYGIVAFGVTQRVREFGIRHALGADSGSILSLVLAEGLRTAGVGIVIGLLGALALTRSLQSLLFGVTAHDPLVFAGVAAVLLAVALAACYVPARRATRVDPMVALRES